MISRAPRPCLTRRARTQLYWPTVLARLPLATSPLPLSRLLLTSIVVVAPAGFFLVILVTANELSASAALFALAGVCLVVIILSRPLLKSLAALRETIERMASGDETLSSSKDSNLLSAELWRALSRFVRHSHQRLADSRAELAATLAVLAALPDPIILLDERRRVVRANEAATEWR